MLYTQDVGFNQIKNFIVRKCVNPACGLRYTLNSKEEHWNLHCPRCRSESVAVAHFTQQVIPDSMHGSNDIRIEVLLDNIRSAWNVGAIFRTADGASVAKIHLSGLSPTPEQGKLAKTGLGAEKSIPWDYYADGALACLEYKKQGFIIWALEGGPRSENLFDISPPLGEKLLVVLGNEVTGIDPQILEQCDRVTFLPMLGMKGSLNVAVAFGALVYTLRFGKRMGHDGEDG